MINVAVVGAGFMGETHGTAYQNIESACLTAICEQNEIKGVEYAKKFGCKHYSTLEKMLDECDIDVVDICVPTFLHEEIAIKVAKAGKNIICEKPVTLNIESLDRILAEVKKTGVTMYVGQVIRFWPEYVKAKEIIDSGDLGELKSYYAARLSEHPAWSEWYRRVENSGGGLLDLHLHDIDFACYLFGKVEKVYAIGKKNESGCWNHVTSILTFQSGVQVTIEGILEMAAGYPFTMELRMVGDKKVYEYVMKAGKNLEDVASSVRSAYVYENGEQKKLLIDETDAYQVELAHFIECLNEKRCSEVINMEQVRCVLCTIRALQQSLEEKKEIVVSYE